MRAVQQARRSRPRRDEMLVFWRGPTCLAGTIPQPAHPIGYAVARPKGRAFIRARRWRPAPPSPAARFAHSPHPPLGLRPRQEKRIPERGKGALYRHPLRLRLAVGAISASAAAIAARSHGALPPPCPRKPPAGGWARRWRASPHPTRQRGNRTSAQACAARSALPALPPWFVHRAPLHRPGPACGRFRGARRWPIKQPAPLRLPWPARAPRLAPSLVAPRAIARPSPAASSARKHQLGLPRLLFAGPAGFLLHFFSFRLANICSIWYNCIGRFCL